MDEHFLAAAGGVGELPLVAAVHPPGHQATPRAGRLAGTSPGQHVHRPAHRDDTFDGQASQVRDQDGKSFKIARLS